MDLQYVFADVNTPWYPDWHYLGSRNWHKGDGTPWPTYGEMETTPQRWTNGQRLVDVPLTLIGTQSVFGSTLPGIIGEPFQGTIDGFDARCWRNGKPFLDVGAAIPAKTSWLAASDLVEAAGGPLSAEISWKAASDLVEAGGGPLSAEISWKAASDLVQAGGGEIMAKGVWSAVSSVVAAGGGRIPAAGNWKETSLHVKGSGPGIVPPKANWHATSAKTP